MMLAAKYRDQDPAGWWASEKLDGWRAFWDGECLRSRTWNRIPVPPEITAGLPAGMALDGELWAGRGGLLTLQSLCRRAAATDPRWAAVRFMVFDAPTTEAKPLELRLLTARAAAHGPQVGFVEQVRIANREAMWRMFADVVTGGGEGLVLREPGSCYRFERSVKWLKVKPSGVE